MHIKYHLVMEIVIFAIFFYMLDLTAALIIVAFHFIPSLDLLTKKFHRKLLHNVFVLVIAGIFVFIFAHWFVAILATANLALHLLLDTNHDGIMLFFPMSEYRLKI